MGVRVLVVRLQVRLRHQHLRTGQGAGHRGGVAHDNGHGNVFFHRFHRRHGDKVRRVIGVLVAVKNVVAAVIGVIGIRRKHADLAPVKTLLQFCVGEMAGHVGVLLRVVLHRGVNSHHGADKGRHSGDRAADCAVAQLNGCEFDPLTGHIPVIQVFAGVCQFRGLKHG